MVGRSGIVAAALGGALGWGLVALQRPASDLAPLVRTAERVESGRLIDLLTVEELGDDPDPLRKGRKWTHGLWAEARARRWADFGHGTRSASVALPALADTDAHWVARALWGQPGVEAELTRRIESEPSPVLYEARARWRLGRGDEDGGLEDLLAAQELQPNRRHTRLTLARHFARTGALDAADELYQQLQADFPKDAAVWIETFTARGSQPPAAPPFPDSCHPFERGRWELLQSATSGSSLSDGARSAYPDRLGYQRLIGDVLLARGEADDALAQYERVQQMKDDFGLRIAMARARFAQRLSRCVDPSSLPETVLDDEGRIWGRLQVHPGHFEPVLYAPNERLFPEAAYAELAQDPGPESNWYPTLSAVNRVGLAKLCLLGQNPRRASQYLERAASIDEDLVEPVLRARALIEAGRARAAVQVLEQHEDGSPAVAWVRAEAWAATGKLEPALQALEAVLSSSTTVSPHAQLQAARWQAELGRTEDALSSLRQAAERLQLRDPESWLEAELLWRNDDPKDALSRARTLIEQASVPRRGLAGYLAARALEDVDAGRAEQVYAEVVDDPQVPEDGWVRYAKLVHARSRSASRRIVQRALGATRDPELRRELQRLR